MGSRYFVSAANASKIVFLKDAAIKKLWKQLEDVYTKLQDPVELTLDGLMFYHVYAADLVMLSKSTHLGKSAWI